MCEESRLDVWDTLNDVEMMIEHLKERLTMREDVDVSKFQELQTYSSNLRHDQKYIPDL